VGHSKNGLVPVTLMLVFPMIVAFAALEATGVTFWFIGKEK